MRITPSAAMLMTNTAAFLGFSGDAFCDLGHAHVIYLWQGPCSGLLVMYNAQDAFCCNING